MGEVVGGSKVAVGDAVDARGTELSAEANAVAATVVGRAAEEGVVKLRVLAAAGAADAGDVGNAERGQGGEFRVNL